MINSQGKATLYNRLYIITLFTDQCQLYVTIHNLSEKTLALQGMYKACCTRSVYAQIIYEVYKRKYITLINQDNESNELM